MKLLGGIVQISFRPFTLLNELYATLWMHRPPAEMLPLDLPSFLSRFDVGSLCYKRLPRLHASFRL